MSFQRQEDSPFKQRVIAHVLFVQRCKNTNWHIITFDYSGGAALKEVQSLAVVVAHQKIMMQFILRDG